MNLPKTNDEWFSIIQECRASGLSDKDWCREHGISPSSFYYNIRKFKALACDIPASTGRPYAPVKQEVVPLRIAGQTAVVSEFTRNGQPFQSTALSFLIESNGISVTFPDGISASTVCSVIHALRQGC